MCKKMYKVIFFLKDNIPSSEKFKDQIENRLSINQKKNFTPQINNIPSTIGKDIQEIIINMTPNSLNMENEEYFLNGFGNRIEFGQKDIKTEENDSILDFKEKVKNIVSLLEDGFLEVIRIGYVYTFFEPEISLSEKLDISFLKEKQDVQLQFNKRTTINNLVFNNFISIMDNWNNQKGIAVIQDFNSVPFIDSILNQEIILNVFNCLEEEYYKKNILDELLK